METCEQCGAKTVEYKHSLSYGLMRVLMAMQDLGGTARTDDLPLSRSDKDNAQKLRYWDLITHERKGQPWSLTDRAQEFLAGRLRVSKSVWTYRGERVRYEGELVSAVEVADFYRQRENYVADALPRPVTLRHFE